MKDNLHRKLFSWMGMAGKKEAKVENEIDLVKLTKERVYLDSIGEKDDGKKVSVAGWLYDNRDLGKIRFIVLRDITGEIQVTGIKNETDKEVFEAMAKTSRESVVVISGTVKKSAKAPGGREILPDIASELILRQIASVSGC